MGEHEFITPGETPAPAEAPSLPGLDVNSLTLGEVGMIENLSGLSIGHLADSSAPKGLLMQAIVYVVKRRQDPSYTFASAALVTFGEMTKLLAPPSEDNAPSV